MLRPTAHPLALITITAVVFTTIGCEEDVRTKPSYLRSQNDYQSNDPARAQLPTPQNANQGSGWDQFTKSMDDFFFGWAKESSTPQPHPAYQPPTARTGNTGSIGGGTPRSPDSPGTGPTPGSRQ